MAKKKIILDLDTGIDDALALAYCLNSIAADLIGITCTYGNVLLQTGARNALAILHLFGRDDVPVYLGLSHSRASEKFELAPMAARIHGANGIGDVEIPDSPRSPEKTPAVDFIVDAADTYGENLIYVPTGPLTNLAAVLDKDPSFKEKVGRVVMMGGALTVRGNIRPYAEANVYKDPEAADLVFRSGLDLTMVGLDVTNRTLLTKDQTASWRELGTPAGAFLADMADYYIDYSTRNIGFAGCALHDPLAVAAALDPALITTIDVNMRVDLDGATRGRTIGDHLLQNVFPKTTHVAIDVNVPRFLSKFMTRTIAVAK